jgi:hypothetical protein
VQEASALPNSVLGVPLMRTAFHPATGQLTDPSADGGEKDASMALFAGAIGSYSNETQLIEIARYQPRCHTAECADFSRYWTLT